MEDELLTFPQTAAVLEQLAQDVKAGYIDQLKRSGHYTTRGTDTRLVDSVTTVVTVDGHSFAVSLRLNDYWRYVEEGTKPHWPPRDAILRWVEIKPVIPRPDGNGRIPTPRQLAFLISRKISEVGTKGTHDLQRAKDAIIPDYIPRIEDALQQDIGDDIRAVFTW